MKVLIRKLTENTLLTIHEAAIDITTLFYTHTYTHTGTKKLTLK